MRRPLTTKVRHIALCLPLFGLVLLLPPAIKIFAMSASVMGVPLIVIYVFGIWAALIVGTATLARHLGREEIIDHPAKPRQAQVRDSAV